MSMFASMGQGEFWSNVSSFPFVQSRIYEILEKEDFTLEELLAEDELLQEVKAKNERLMPFLCAEEQVAKLVCYIRYEARPDDDDLRTFKYPYMSCEVICCEVPEILQRLVDENGGKLLDELFGILDSNKAINHYLAGYFEKVLEVLFRRKTIQLMSYLNARGVQLLQRFLKHIDNYSIMQIIQRLLLPHIPFSIDTADLEAISPEDRDNCQCNWSFLPDTADMLTSRMLDAHDKDVPYHVSDLLITVVQLSAPDAPFLGHLCDNRNLNKLLKAAFVSSELQEEAIGSSDVALASVSVLESLISRLCETSNPFDGINMGVQQEGPHEKSITQLAAIQSVSAMLIQHIPGLCEQLNTFISSDPVGVITLQTKQEVPRLGQKGLQLVKLVEASIRLSVPELDAALCQTGTLAACLDLFFKYEMNSLLHLSVQRIALMVLEGGAARRRTQRHLMVECRLLERLLKVLRDRKTTALDQPNARRPIFGHLIVISQIIVTVLHSETANEPPPLPPRRTLASETESEIRSTMGEAPISESSSEAPRPTSANDDMIGGNMPMVHLKDIVAETGLASAWEEFVNGDFMEIITAQTTYLGGSDFAARQMEAQMGMNMGMGMEMGGGFQIDARDVAELEQAIHDMNFSSNDNTSRDWLSGNSTSAHADGDLLAVANQVSRSAIIRPGGFDDDHDAMSDGSDEAPEKDRFHDDDEATTPNAESTAALGQTLFFASFETPSDQFEAFAAFPSSQQTTSTTADASAGPTNAFGDFAAFPEASSGNLVSFPEPHEDSREQTTATTAAEDDPFARVTPVDVLANEEGNNHTNNNNNDDDDGNTNTNNNSNTSA